MGDDMARGDILFAIMALILLIALIGTVIIMIVVKEKNYGTFGKMYETELNKSYDLKRDIYKNNNKK